MGFKISKCSKKLQKEEKAQNLVQNRVFAFAKNLTN